MRGWAETLGPFFVWGRIWGRISLVATFHGPAQSRRRVEDVKGKRGPIPDCPGLWTISSSGSNSVISCTSAIAVVDPLMLWRDVQIFPFVDSHLALDARTTRLDLALQRAGSGVRGHAGAGAQSAGEFQPGWAVEVRSGAHSER